MKEKILSVTFSENPDVRLRVINSDDALVLKQNKKKYPVLFYFFCFFCKLNREKLQGE